MSHFQHEIDITRFIGSSPGFIGYEQGGQLTNALKANPCSVVLFDEIEKAHAHVRKFFLPLFDDGVIRDAQGHAHDCKDAIFIMTSNLCSMEILELCQEGYSHEEILDMIEPYLIQALSPEFYNRVMPVVFNPLTKESMRNLVKVMLKEVTERVETSKNIEIHFDESVIDYLTTNGFHPKLGARPLKRLIEKSIVSTLSVAMVNNEYPENSTLVMSYSPDESWTISWFELEPKQLEVIEFN